MSGKLMIACVLVLRPLRRIISIETEESFVSVPKPREAENIINCHRKGRLATTRE